MDKETADHVKQVIETVAQYKEGISIMFISIGTAALFWLRHSFVTRKALDQYDNKNESTHNKIIGTVDELDKKVDTIAENIAWMRGKMEKLHPHE